MRKCPMCREQISEATLTEITPSSSNDTVVDGNIMTFHDYLGRKCSMDKHCYDLHSTTVSSKMKQVDKMIQEIDGSIIIFSQYKSVLTLLKEKYPEAEIITGSKSRSQRKKAIEKFQNKESKIFLLSTKCAAVGITLTAGSHMIFMEPLLDDTVKKQAIGRINRKGQEKANIYIHTLVNKEIDFFINNKKKIFNRYVNHEVNMVQYKKNFLRESMIRYLERVI